MRGRNELHLNVATLIEALQHYFDGEFSDGLSPTVKGITYSGGSAPVFIVHVEETQSNGNPQKA